MARARSVDDIVNDIFDLDLDWSFSPTERILDEADLSEFSELCGELTRALLNADFHAAVWFLSQARHFIGFECTATGEVRSLELSGAQRKRLRETLGRSMDLAIGQELPMLPRRGPILEILFSQAETGPVFRALLEAERKILRKSGLNQKSVSVVLDRLQSYESSITRNLRASRSIGQNVLSSSTFALETLAARPIWRLRSKKSLRAACSNMRNRLSDAKDKVIGLATIWADTVPLLAASDWGVASVFSTVAGGTVAAVLPRNPRKTVD